MLDFSCDYKNGAHPIVLRRLIETNEETLDTYGFDKYSASAKEKIRKAAGVPGADVFFIAGGTQTNMTADTQSNGQLRSQSKNVLFPFSMFKE